MNNIFTLKRWSKIHATRERFNQSGKKYKLLSISESDSWKLSNLNWFYLAFDLSCNKAPEFRGQFSMVCTAGKVDMCSLWALYNQLLWSSEKGTGTRCRLLHQLENPNQNWKIWQTFLEAIKRTKWHQGFGRVCGFYFCSREPQEAVHIRVLARPLHSELLRLLGLCLCQALDNINALENPWHCYRKSSCTSCKQHCVWCQALQSIPNWGMAHIHTAVILMLQDIPYS